MTNESAELRKSLERFQQAIDALADRYLELRRERKRNLERIAELEQERAAAEMTISVHQEIVNQERKRGTELEERVIQGDRRMLELLQRAGELEERVAEREAMIAEQEDTLGQLRHQLSEAQEQGGKFDEHSEQLNAEIAQLKEQLAASQRLNSQRAEQLERTEAERAEEVSTLAAQRDSAVAEIAELRKAITLLGDQRVVAEEKYQQTLSKLDAATRQVSMVRNESALAVTASAQMQAESVQLKQAAAKTDELRHEADELRRRFTSASEELAKLRDDLATTQQKQGGTSLELQMANNEIARVRELLDAREVQIRDAQSDGSKLKDEYAQKLAELEEKHVAFDMELERARRQVASMESERDQAFVQIFSMQNRVKELEELEGEASSQQKFRIEQLTRDLSDALEMAARKEQETLAALQESEAIRAQCFDLHKKAQELTQELHDHRQAAQQLQAEGGMEEGERLALRKRVTEAIEMIDRHLGE